MSRAAGLEGDTADFNAWMLATFRLGMAPTAPLRTGSRPPVFETSNFSFSPPGVPAGPGAIVAAPAAPADRAAPASIGLMPLRFEANQGQTDAQVAFLAHGPGYSLFLTPTEAVMVLEQPSEEFKGVAGAAGVWTPGTHSVATPASAVLRMQVLGGNAAPQVFGLDELPGKVNYFLGNDLADWHTGIPTYAQVEYRNVYSGIDLLYYGHDGRLEYDFDVAPGADPGAITLAFAGADRLAIDAQGDLLLDVGRTQIRQDRPLIYQDVDGSRRQIAGNYVLKDGQRVGFQVGTFDGSRPLVIDPVLSYSTYLGGSGADAGGGIAVDQNGHVYVTGATGSADFPTLDAVQPTLGGGLGNAFVTSLDPAGQPLYSTYLGGSAFDMGNGIAVDPYGHAYVTGTTTSRDFPALNAFQPAYGEGFHDAFVTSLDTTGQLLYSTYLGGSDSDVGAGIAVDQFGQAFVTGTTGSRDLPTRNAFQPTLAGYDNAFVTSLDAVGQPLYSTYLGGSGADDGHGIAVDQFGQAYVTGTTASADFPTRNAFQPTLAGFSNAFVTSLDPAGQLLYSTYLGGSAADYGFGIAVDQDSHAYVTGTTYSVDFPTRNAFQARLAGLENGFVTSLDGAGQALYSTYLGGSGADACFAIAVDQVGHAYVTGPTSSAVFPMLDAFQATYGGGSYDAFVTSLDRGGQELYASYLGGSHVDYGTGIAVDQSGHAYVTGSTGSADFPTLNAFQPTLGGIQNAFVTMIN
jgi:hypothetical protein